jgi:hypothetical protein
MNWGDIFVRAGKTAAQSFLATIPAAAVVEGDWSKVLPVVVAALAAGFSVIQNAVSQYSNSHKVVDQGDQRGE